MAEVTYRIRDWQKHFEVAQSKKIRGSLSWVAVPTKHDGKSYRRLMRMEDGPSLYAAWLLIVQIAAKCPERGVLFDDGNPLTAEDLEIKTDCPASIFRKALKVLCDDKIGWMESVSVERSTTMVDDATTDLGAQPTPLPTQDGPDGRTDGTDKTDRTNKFPVGRIEPSADLKSTFATHPICADLKRKLHPKAANDRRLIASVAALVDAGELIAADVASASQAVTACKSCRKPVAYFFSSLRDACAENGKNLDALLSRVQFGTGPPPNVQTESVPQVPLNKAKAPTRNDY